MNAVYAALTVPALFLATRRLAGPLAARACAALFVASPMLMIAAATEMSNTTCFAALAWMLASYLYARDDARASLLPHAGVGLFFGIAVLIRPPSAFGAGLPCPRRLGDRGPPWLARGPWPAPRRVRDPGGGHRGALLRDQQGPKRLVLSRLVRPRVPVREGERAPLQQLGGAGVAREGGLARAALLPLSAARSHPRRRRHRPPPPRLRSLRLDPLAPSFRPVRAPRRTARSSSSRWWAATSSSTTASTSRGSTSSARTTTSRSRSRSSSCPRSASRRSRAGSARTGRRRRRAGRRRSVVGLSAATLVGYDPPRARALLGIARDVNFARDTIAEGEVHQAIVFSPRPFTAAFTECREPFEEHFVGWRPNNDPDLKNDVLWVNHVSLAEDKKLLGSGVPGAARIRLSSSTRSATGSSSFLAEVRPGEVPDADVYGDKRLLVGPQAGNETLGRARAPTRRWMGCGSSWSTWRRWSVALAFVVHIAWWRWRRPPWRTSRRSSPCSFAGPSGRVCRPLCCGRC